MQLSFHLLLSQVIDQFHQVDQWQHDVTIVQDQMVVSRQVGYFAYVYSAKNRCLTLSEFLILALI